MRIIFNLFVVIFPVLALAQNHSSIYQVTYRLYEKEKVSGNEIKHYTDFKHE